VNIAQPQLLRQPFHVSGKPLIFVHYQSQVAAQRFLQDILKDPRGVGLLYGPASSGKKTTVRQFLRCQPVRFAIADIDGTRLKPEELLRSMLQAFGHGPVTGSSDRLLKTLVIFLLQQTRNSQPPLLVVGNINKMFPAALRVLCKLAAVRLHGKFALRIIMHCQVPSFAIVHAAAMSGISSRMISAFELGPLTEQESIRYLYSKLRAAACQHPEQLLAPATCSRLHKESGGWPGILDGIAIQALQQNARLLEQTQRSSVAPVQAVASRLISSSIPDPEQELEMRKLLVSLNGRTLQEFDLADSKTLIGRSSLCDLPINSRFVSKFHAMILRHDNDLFLIDLNSSNGTFVNSQRVLTKALRHDDIISLGNHGIKLFSPGIVVRSPPIDPNLAATAKMKTLGDMRRLRASESMKVAEVKNRTP
jgi:type II secretory pathway predicted ATPase ExeA